MFAPRWILLVYGIAALNFGGTLAGQTDRADVFRIPSRKPSSRSLTVLSSERIGSGTSPTPCGASPEWGRYGG